MQFPRSLRLPCRGASLWEGFLPSLLADPFVAGEAITAAVFWLSFVRGHFELWTVTQARLRRLAPMGHRRAQEPIREHCDW